MICFFCLPCWCASGVWIWLNQHTACCRCDFGALDSRWDFCYCSRGPCVHCRLLDIMSINHAVGFTCLFIRIFMILHVCMFVNIYNIYIFIYVCDMLRWWTPSSTGQGELLGNTAVLDALAEAVLPTPSSKLTTANQDQPRTSHNTGNGYEWLWMTKGDNKQNLRSRNKLYHEVMVMGDNEKVIIRVTKRNKEVMAKGD